MTARPLHPTLEQPVLMLEGVDHSMRWQAGERLHHLFEARCDALRAAGRQTHHAVESDAGSWTYAELDACANRLARALRALGRGPGDRIALLFDKSAWSYAAMLAMSKIHAAYVPLDASFPAERIAFIIADAGVSHLLSTRNHAALLADAGAPVLWVDAWAPGAQALSGARLHSEERGEPVDELAYIIYTSGSTGRPKGVPIDHGQVINFVRVAAERYGYQADDRVYQGLTLAFDFAVEEIWVPLSVGATLLPNQTGSSLLGAELAEFLRRHQVTALCCVPTLLATLDEPLPSLRLLIVSGEACPRDLVSRWHQPGRRFLNAYGPTEITVTATLGEPVPGEPVTIGRPLPTYAVVILDPEEARALPFGSEGEIGIAGPGVARGYLHRDEQTRRAFIPDFLGLAHNRSGRIYRTGDLGRINAHGEVEYLGRIDTQVKIRGYRIELAEIESLLLQLPGIAQAVVNTWPSSPGVLELVAYYTQRPGSAPLTGETLAQHLRAALPGYMVPAFYERLDHLPMLASDKADRKALPAPTRGRLQTGAAQFVGPATPLEARIAAELAAALQLPQVSVEDHFFEDLGLSSLLMARWGAQLRRALGQDDGLAMRDLYAHPSVRALATHVARMPVALQTPHAQRAPSRPVHEATRLAYLACGLAQALLAFAFLWAHAAAWWAVHEAVLAATTWAGAWQAAAGGSALYLLAAAALPIALKWLLVGRWRAGEFPVWSWAYLRFWTVKALLRSHPMNLFTGSALQVVCLRLFGAQVAWSAHVPLRQVPVCTDLLSIGPGAVLGAHTVVPGYRVDGGRVRTGPIVIGAGAKVGEGALVDIDTRIGAGGRLAHASSLHAGQVIAPGEHMHGSPAQTCDRAGGIEHDAALDAVPPASARRHLAYTGWQLVGTLGIVLPAPFLLLYAAMGQDGQALAALTDALGLALPTSVLAGGEAALASAGWVRLLTWTWAGYLASLCAGLLVVLLLPRLLTCALSPGRVYPLYGPHDAVRRLVRTLSNVQLYHTLFGDSSAIVHYLTAVGYRLRPLVQTGSNFGLEQQHDVPALCRIGRGTMVSDGLVMLNAEQGAHAFRLAPVEIGTRNFLGNKLMVPPHHRVGDNVLLASKVMLPVDGPLRSDVGLLGSPPFEIPRTPRREGLQRFDAAAQADRLSQKNRANLRSMLGFVVSNGLVLSVLALVWQLSWPMFKQHDSLFLAVYGFLSMPVTLACYVLIDFLSRGGRPLQPMRCSILEPAFWRHERHWKLGLSNDHPMVQALAGTPARGLLWRALGVKVGRQLFDDGASLPEKTLVRLGDHCTLGAGALIQAHSLEDGAFESDRIDIGPHCTVGANAYVHYGTALGAGASIAPDAFVMKGESLAPDSRWEGNPARPVASHGGRAKP